MSTEHDNDTCKEKIFHKNGDMDLLEKRKITLMYTTWSKKYFFNMNYQQQLPRKVSETSLLQEKIVLSEARKFDYFYFKDKLSFFYFLNKISFQEKLLDSNYFISNCNAVLRLL